MDKITNYKNNTWLFSKEAKKFRKRKIPSYLLAKETPEYPIYLSQSSLSKAFSNINRIVLRVHLYKYQKEIQESLDHLSKLEQQTKSSYMNNNRMVGGDGLLEQQFLYNIGM